MGADALRDQLVLALLVYSSCECGCGSIGFEHTADATPALAEDGLYSVEAMVMAESGESVGELLHAIRGGLLHDIDAFSTADQPIALPSLDRIRWVGKK